MRLDCDLIAPIIGVLKRERTFFKAIVIGRRTANGKRMAKENEIDYINQVARIEDVPLEQFRQYLENKPFSDLLCGS